MTATIEQLKEKIELFRKNIKDYKSKDYDEYNTRADFIDVLFSALGWDMYNEQKIIEQFREVVREDKIVIEGSKRALTIPSELARILSFMLRQRNLLLT